ncbi:hypothetical protein M8494_35760 [Serratia ureilytica]
MRARSALFGRKHLPPSQALPTCASGGEAYGVRRLSTHHRLPAAVSQRLAQLAETSGISGPTCWWRCPAAWLFQVMPRDTRQGDTRRCGCRR